MIKTNSLFVIRGLSHFKCVMFINVFIWNFKEKNTYD